MPCISAAAIFHVPTKPSFVLAAELLALPEVLADELAVEALSEEAIADAELALAEELAADELADPPQATNAKHATMRHAIAAIAANLVPSFLLAFIRPPFRLASRGVRFPNLPEL